MSFIESHINQSEILNFYFIGKKKTHLNDFVEFWIKGTDWCFFSDGSWENINATETGKILDII